MKIRAFAWTALVCACVASAVFVSLAIKGFVEKQTVPTVSAGTEEITDPLSEFVLQQEQLRSMQLSELDRIISSEDSPQEIREAANREKLELIEKLEMEQTVSGILRARGYRDAACSAGDGYVTVLVRSSQLSETDAARITELVISSGGPDPGNIKIIPIN